MNSNSGLTEKTQSSNAYKQFWYPLFFLPSSMYELQCAKNRLIVLAHLVYITRALTVILRWVPTVCCDESHRYTVVENKSFCRKKLQPSPLVWGFSVISRRQNSAKLNRVNEDVGELAHTRQHSLTLSREYWMFYRGPVILAVVWFGSSPSPPSFVSKLDRRHTGRLRRIFNLLTGEGGKRLWEEPNHATARNPGPL